jgi:Protein of unknown function (DUF938)
MPPFWARVLPWRGARAAEIPGRSLWWLPTDLVAPTTPKSATLAHASQTTNCDDVAKVDGAGPLKSAVRRWREFADETDANAVGPPSASEPAEASSHDVERFREIRRLCVLDFMALDVGKEGWWDSAPAVRLAQCFGGEGFDVYACNVLHIVPWDALKCFCAGLGSIVRPRRRFIYYGSFRRGGEFSGPGDAKFNDWLRENYEGGGVRDLEDVSALLAEQGFEEEAIHEMPANNIMVVWIRSQTGQGTQ